MRATHRAIPQPRAFHSDPPSVISLGQTPSGPRRTNEYVDSPRAVATPPLKPHLPTNVLIGGGGGNHGGGGGTGVIANSPGFGPRAVHQQPRGGGGGSLGGGVGGGGNGGGGSPRPILPPSTTAVISQQPLSKSSPLKKDGGPVTPLSQQHNGRGGGGHNHHYHCRADDHDASSGDFHHRAMGTNNHGEAGGGGGGVGIMCERCKKCQCSSCTDPRPLPSHWCCGNKCEFSAEKALDFGTCFCCIKGCFYHSGSEEDNECYENPCGCCSTPHCCRRWTVISLTGLCLPCLWAYWPARGCLALCTSCYNRCRRKGCQCHHSKLLDKDKSSVLSGVVGGGGSGGGGSGSGCGGGVGAGGGNSNKHSQTRRLLVESDSSSA